MHSLRLPKRLIMHGDDERDHMFLVSAMSKRNRSVYRYFEIFVFLLLVWIVQVVPRADRLDWHRFGDQRRPIGEPAL